MRLLNKILIKELWHYIDVICYLLAMIFIVYGVFQFNYILGYIALGIAFLVTGIITGYLPANNGKGGEK